MSTTKIHIARVSIEFTTPFLVASGQADWAADASPISDANDLPTIPGTSLCGMMRHGFAKRHGEKRTTEVFGSSAGMGAQGGSRLWVSWAKLHGADNRPIDGLVFEFESDPVVDLARASSLRDHVRIGHHGSVDGAGKFDQQVVATGHRFTFELSYEEEAGEVGAAGDVDWLLSYLASGRGRIGGSGRRGLGAFKVIEISRRCFDLASASDATAYTKLAVSLRQTSKALKPYKPEELPIDTKSRRFVMRIAAEGHWGVNGSEAWLTPEEENEKDAKTPDFNPYRDMRVEWKSGKGKVSQPRMVLPGSSIKGAIAHRVCFHHNARIARFSDAANAPEDLSEWSGSNNPAVAELFGKAVESNDDGGCAGHVFIDDVWLLATYDKRLCRVMHNSQDRFTGGVRSGVLFEERVIDGGSPITINIDVDNMESMKPDVLDALRETLRDLAEGRLSIGAGGGRGNGYFEWWGTLGFDDTWQEFVAGVNHE